MSETSASIRKFSFLVLSIFFGTYRYLSRNSDPGSHSKRFPPRPTRYDTCLVLLSREEDLTTALTFFPRRLVSNTSEFVVFAVSGSVVSGLVASSRSCCCCSTKQVLTYQVQFSIYCSGVFTRGLRRRPGGRGPE